MLPWLLLVCWGIPACAWHRPSPPTPQPRAAVQPEKVPPVTQPRESRTEDLSPPANQKPETRWETLGRVRLLVDQDAAAEGGTVTGLWVPPAQHRAELPGLLHVTEEVLMDPALPTGRQVASLRARGWRVVAFTTPEYTAYQVTGSHAVMAEGLRLLRQLGETPPWVGISGAQQDEIVRRRGAEQAPAQQSRLASELQALFLGSYVNHPFAVAIEGTEATRRQIDGAALQAAWEQIYQRGELTVVLSGAVTEQVLVQARSELGHLGTRSVPSSAEEAVPIGVQAPGPRVITSPPETKDGAGGPPTMAAAFSLQDATPRELLALELLAALGPQPHGAAVSFDGSAAEATAPARLLVRGRGPGLWVMRQPAHGEPAAQVRELGATCRNLEGQITEKALEEGKRRLIEGLSRRAETSSGRGLLHGILALRNTSLQEHLQGLLQVRRSDVEGAIKRLLRPDSLTLLVSQRSAQGFAHSTDDVLTWWRGEDPPRSEQAVSGTHSDGNVTTKPRLWRGPRGDEVITWPSGSGLHPAVRGRVGLALTWPGGRHQEDAEHLGVHALLLRAWPSAMQALSARPLGARRELLRALQATVEADSLSLTMDIAGADSGQALVLLREVLEAQVVSERDVEHARHELLRAGAASGSLDAMEGMQLAWQLFDDVPPGRTTAHKAGWAWTTMSARKLHAYWQRSYAQKPFVLTLVGDFDEAAVRRALTEWLGALSPKAAADKGQVASEAKRQAPLDPLLRGYAETGMVHAVTAQALSNGSTTDSAALDVLVELLAPQDGADKGLLRHALLSAGVTVYDVWAGQSQRAGHAWLGLACKLGTRGWDQGVRRLDEFFTSLRLHDLSEPLIARAKERLAARWVLRGQRRVQRALELSQLRLAHPHQAEWLHALPPALWSAVDRPALWSVVQSQLLAGPRVQRVVLPHALAVARAPDALPTQQRPPDRRAASTARVDAKPSGQRSLRKSSHRPPQHRTSQLASRGRKKG